jgi:hypothetical protein
MYIHTSPGNLVSQKWCFEALPPQLEKDVFVLFLSFLKPLSSLERAVRGKLFSWLWMWLAAIEVL